MQRHTWLLVLLLFISLSSLQSQVLGTGVEYGVEDPLPDNGYYFLPSDNDSLNALPLPQLGTGYSYGFQGGLFAGGSNQDPNPHFANGKNISKALKPLNAAGAIDFVTGQLPLIGVGPSVASDPFNEWKSAQGDLDWPGVNKCLNVKGNFIGGKSIVDMLDPAGTYWANFTSGLASKGITPVQVQVVWMLLMSSTDTTTAAAYVDTVSKQYIQVIHNLYAVCPNLKQIFISGIHYTGYTAVDHKRYDYIKEPFGYWSNLVVKNVIGLQINGDSRLIYTGARINAPFITWGPYFWADGITPRATDGIVWPCSYFRDDTIGGGFHVKDEYKYIEADLIDSFFSNNAIAKLWYKNSATWTGCTPVRLGEEEEEANTDNIALPVFPSPANNRIVIPVLPALVDETELTIYNSNGSLIYRKMFNAKTELSISVSVQELPVGIYYVQMADRTKKFSGTFVKQ